MTTPAHTFNPRENHILAALSADEFERLRPHMEQVELRRGAILTHADEKIEHGYFPHHGIISAVAMMRDGSEVEVCLIGREGTSAIPLFLGTDSLPIQTIVQVPDGATRIRADILRAESERGGELQRLVLRYAQAFFVQAAQTAACNRLHKLDERLARWLLMCQDRMQSAEIELTHEVMAIMLGVRRAGVTEALGLLQRAGLVKIARGHVTILDRAGLQQTACECYGVISREFARLDERSAQLVG